MRGSRTLRRLRGGYVGFFAPGRGPSPWETEDFGGADLDEVSQELWDDMDDVVRRWLPSDLLESLGIAGAGDGGAERP